MVWELTNSLLTIIILTVHIELFCGDFCVHLTKENSQSNQYENNKNKPSSSLFSQNVEKLELSKTYYTLKIYS